MGRHEIDDLRRDFLGGNRQIAFIFAILVIHDDEDPPGANLFDGLRNGDKRHTLIVAQVSPREDQPITFALSEAIPALSSEKLLKIVGQDGILRADGIGALRTGQQAG
jgi:hypothetical protein